MHWLLTVLLALAPAALPATAGAQAAADTLPERVVDRVYETINRCDVAAFNALFAPVVYGSAMERFGRVDVVINNAGMRLRNLYPQGHRTTLETEVGHWQRLSAWRKSIAIGSFAVGTFGLGFTLGGLVFGRWRKA